MGQSGRSAGLSRVADSDVLANNKKHSGQGAEQADPLVSIVIPVYNTGKSAAKLIQTLLSSDYANLEIIAVDDGSTDDSLKFLRAVQDPLAKIGTFAQTPNHPADIKKSASTYQKSLPQNRNSRLRILSQKNSGASSARNFGLSKVSGEYVAFFDSDDSVDPEIIRKMVSVFTGAASPHFPEISTSSTNNPVASRTPEKSSPSAQPTSSAIISRTSKTSVSSARPEVILATCAYRYHRVRQNTTQDIYANPPVQPQPGDSFPAYILRLLLADGRLYAVINKLFRTDIIRRHQLEFDVNLNFAEDTKFVLDYLKYSYYDIFSTNNPAKSTNTSEKNPPYDIKPAQNSIAKNPSGDIFPAESTPDWHTALAFLPDPLYHYNYGTATSTVASSSLPWENWQTSFDNLQTWLNNFSTPPEAAQKSSSTNKKNPTPPVKKSAATQKITPTSTPPLAKSPAQATPPTPTEQKLLKKVHARWQISHALAVARANLPLSEKRRYLSLPKLALAKIALLFRK